MKTEKNEKAIEAYKIFPYVAWLLTFAFALFVYNITNDLKEVTKELQHHTYNLEQKMQKQDISVIDYEE